MEERKKPKDALRIDSPGLLEREGLVRKTEGDEAVFGEEEDWPSGVTSLGEEELGWAGERRLRSDMLERRRRE